MCLMAIITIFASCSKDDDPSLPGATNDTAIIVPFFIQNENGEIPTSNDQLIYETRKNNPVLAPDGHQLTWGEFSEVEGQADVQCQDNGVLVDVELTGLIPNGVYTLWNIVFEEPGMDPTKEMLGLSGLGASGIGDGSDNSFVASADGKATLSVLSPGGSLSIISNTDLGQCPLTDNFEWHVVGAYHIDGTNHGPSLGPDGTAIEQFGFIFKKEE